MNKKQKVLADNEGGEISTPLHTTPVLLSRSCVGCCPTVSLVSISLVASVIAIRTQWSINEVFVNICMTRTTRNCVLLFDYGGSRTQTCWTMRVKAMRGSLNLLVSMAMTRLW